MQAANYLKLHLLAFMIGRFGGSALMKRFAPASMLATFAVGSLASVALVLLNRGPAALAGIVLLGFFHSIMFPTIFALSIRHLGPATRKGSSLLVMSIIGGAICPAIMGRMSDATNIQVAFLIPLICYCFVLYFGLRGYRPAHLLAPEIGGLNCFSDRNASIGFTRAARRAGRYAASMPLKNSSTAAPASVQPSCAFTPYKNPRTSRPDSQRQPDASHDAQQQHRARLPHHQPQQIRALRAQRDAHAHLARSLRHHIRQQPVQACHAKQQRRSAKNLQQMRRQPLAAKRILHNLIHRRKRRVRQLRTCLPQ